MKISVALALLIIDSFSWQTGREKEKPIIKSDTLWYIPYLFIASQVHELERNDYNPFALEQVIPKINSHVEEDLDRYL